MKPVCVKCRLFYRPKKNGAYFEEGMPIGETGQWKSYKLWVGDLWACRGCGAEIIIGVGGQIAEHFQPNYAHACQERGSLLRVDDC
jgi:hypothetical protein